MRWTGILFVAALGCSAADLTGTYRVAKVTVSTPCDAQPVAVDASGYTRFERRGDDFAEVGCDAPTVCFTSPVTLWKESGGAWKIESGRAIGPSSSCLFEYIELIADRDGTALVITRGTYNDGPTSADDCTDAGAVRRGTSMRCAMMIRTEYALVE